ncbi:hypothetical protein ACFX5D_15120 [Flavobacterium sp. LB3P45]|uniref:Uncharacterized protein n=1 Tax=Flavobacterium fructosi TaxID=3230416 RepID=A0ABW6HR26_9FLAO
MPYLTESEVRDAFPHSAAPLKLSVYHRIEWWDEIILPVPLPAPIRLTFTDTIRNTMPVNIRNGKGLYFFFLEPEHPINLNISQLVYIGRVLGGALDNHNFYLRFREYVNAIGNRAVKRNTMRMTNLWPNKTYVYFFELNHFTDAQIVVYEDLLIQKIVPALNEKLSGIARQTRLLH